MTEQKTDIWQNEHQLVVGIVPEKDKKKLKKEDPMRKLIRNIRDMADEALGVAKNGAVVAVVPVGEVVVSAGFVRHKRDITQAVLPYISADDEVNATKACDQSKTYVAELVLREAEA